MVRGRCATWWEAGSTGGEPVVDGGDDTSAQSRSRARRAVPRGAPRGRLNTFVCCSVKGPDPLVVDALNPASSGIER